jgi:SAM-dependent methyltransferase
MGLEPQQLEDVARIMGVDKDMIRLLPRLVHPSQAMNPWVEHLPAVMDQLDLQPGQTVLDIPCGTGRVSVPLAKAYGARIIGYDILPEYIDSARAFVHLHHVDELCEFSATDIRAVVAEHDICDLLLWVAPPHIWDSSKETINRLRGCVRSGGKILVGDAYLNAESAKTSYPEYETLEGTTEGYSVYGDELVRCMDYKGILWEEDYQRTREVALTALSQSTDEKEVQLIRHYLEGLAQDEINDKTHLGLAIWVLKVRK